MTSADELVMHVFLFQLIWLRVFFVTLSQVFYIKDSCKCGIKALNSVHPLLSLVIRWNGVMSLNQRQGCCWCRVTVWLMRSGWFDCAAEQPSVSLKAALIRAGATVCHLILKRFNLELRTMLPLTLRTYTHVHTHAHYVLN